MKTSFSEFLKGLSYFNFFNLLSPQEPGGLPTIAQASQLAAKYSKSYTHVEWGSRIRERAVDYITRIDEANTHLQPYALYMSTFTIYSHLLKETMPVFIKVMQDESNDIEFGDTEKEEMELGFTVCILDHHKKIIGFAFLQIEINQNREDGIRTENEVVISDVWNLKPDLYANVGRALINEIIFSIFKEGTHLLPENRVDTRVNPPPPPIVIEKSGEDDSPTLLNRVLDMAYWKRVTHNALIKVISIHEALGFYGSLNFHPYDPELLMPYDLQFPDYLKVLQDIVGKYDRDPDIYRQFNLDLMALVMVTPNEPGIIDRFRHGSPTETDWKEFSLWKGVMRHDKKLTNDKLDYKEFVERYKNDPLVSKDYMNMDPFLRTTGSLFDEIMRNKEKLKPQLGYHGYIAMYYDLREEHPPVLEHRTPVEIFQATHPEYYTEEQYQKDIDAILGLDELPDSPFYIGEEEANEMRRRVYEMSGVID